MKQMYYHATPKDRLWGIIKEGIKGSGGLVYLCKDEQSTLVFMKAYHPEGGQFVVIPLELDDSQVMESFDHNKKYIPVDAYVHEGDIPPTLLPNTLDGFKLYRLTPVKI